MATIGSPLPVLRIWQLKTIRVVRCHMLMTRWCLLQTLGFRHPAPRLVTDMAERYSQPQKSTVGSLDPTWGPLLLISRFYFFISGGPSLVYGVPWLCEDCRIGSIPRARGWDRGRNYWAGFSSWTPKVRKIMAQKLQNKGLEGHCLTYFWGRQEGEERQETQEGPSVNFLCWVAVFCVAPQSRLPGVGMPTGASCEVCLCWRGQPDPML